MSNEPNRQKSASCAGPAHGLARSYCVHNGRWYSAVRPTGDADAVAGAIGKDPARRGAGFVHAAALGCSRCRHARLDVLANGQRSLPEDSAPEDGVDRLGLSSYRQLNLLRRCLVGDRTVPSRIAGTARARSMCRTSSRNTPRVSRTLRWSSTVKSAPVARQRRVVYRWWNRACRMNRSSPSTRWTSRCSSVSRRDQVPASMCRSGSGLPMPEAGLSGRFR